MCKIISVAPRDWHIALDFSHMQIDHILTYLDRCTATPDVKNPETWKAADQYVRKEFFPLLDKLSDQIKEQK